MKRLNNINEDLRSIILLLIAAGIVQVVYIAVSSFYFRTGFPLDDAWIHQTYARNIAEYGSWSFVPGIISGGSTAPFWTVLLIPGHFFSAPFYYYWTIFISWLIFGMSAYFFNHSTQLITGTSKKYPIWGFLFLLEWHFVWAANSGMETGLFILLILIFFDLLVRDEIFTWKSGIVIGLIIWVRPDGATLFGPLFLLLIVKILKTEAIDLSRIIKIGIIIGGFVSGYLLFNLLISGSFLPNTFFAKQAEYQILYSLPLLDRILDLASLPLVGVGAVLLPGLVYLSYKSVKEVNWKMISIFLWLAGYIILYAVRLPVIYQHGRYIMPGMAVFLLFALVGTIRIFEVLDGFFGRIIKSTTKISLVLVLLIFFGLGADAFAKDVAIIESEMVETALWINQNTEANATIGAHDIGALGFWGKRKIIDLAGLISPDVIPFIRDENRLAVFLDENGADYLMTFPDWYPKLVSGKDVVFKSEFEFSPESGGENMTVYTWSSSH